jgi:DNA repair ATPase RecN
MSSGFLRHIENDVRQQTPQILEALKSKQKTFQETNEKLKKKKTYITPESYENIFHIIDETKISIHDTLENIENIKEEFNSIAKQLNIFDKEMNEISKNVNQHRLKYGLQSLARHVVKTHKKKYSHTPPSPIREIIMRDDSETPYPQYGPKGGRKTRRKN